MNHDALLKLYILFNKIYMYIKQKDMILKKYYKCILKEEISHNLTFGKRDALVFSILLYIDIV